MIHESEVQIGHKSAQIVGQFNVFCRRTGSWRVTVAAGYGNGKQNRVRRTYRFPDDWSQAKQKKEVEKKAALLYAEYCKKQVMPGQEMLFSDYAD